MFIMVSLKSDTRLLMSRLKNTFSQSNEQISRWLVWKDQYWHVDYARLIKLIGRTVYFKIYTSKKRFDDNKLGLRKDQNTRIYY